MPIKNKDVTGNALGEQLLNSVARNTLTIAEHKGRILARHNETDPWDMGEVYAAAAAQLKPDDEKALRKELPFAASMYLKFVSIGRSPWLYEAKIKAMLPKSMSTLYQFSLLRDVEVVTALAEDMVKPTTTRAALIKWKDDKRGTVRKTKTVADTVASAIKKDKAGFMAALGQIGIVPVQDVAPARPVGSIVKATDNDAATAEA
jgi:hypothetical protein